MKSAEHKALSFGGDVKSDTGLRVNLSAFFSFKGRMRRVPFALAGFAILILWQLPEPVLTMLLLYRVPVYGATYMAVVVCLACLAWPLACFAAKRLHDVGLRGWPGAIYLAHLALMLPWAFSNSLPANFIRPWLHAAVAWLLVLTTSVLTVWPGNKGENRFGADPRRGSQRAADMF